MALQLFFRLPNLFNCSTKLRYNEVYNITKWIDLFEIFAKQIRSVNLNHPKIQTLGASRRHYGNLRSNYRTNPNLVFHEWYRDIWTGFQGYLVAIERLDERFETQEISSSEKQNERLQIRLKRLFCFAYRGIDLINGNL